MADNDESIAPASTDHLNLVEALYNNPLATYQRPSASSKASPPPLSQYEKASHAAKREVTGFKEDFFSLLKLPQKARTQVNALKAGESLGLKEGMRRFLNQNNYNLLELLACVFPYIWYHVVANISFIIYYVVLIMLYATHSAWDVLGVAALCFPLVFAAALFPTVHFALIALLDYMLYLPRHYVNRYYRIATYISIVASLFIFLATIPIMLSFLTLSVGSLVFLYGQTSESGNVLRLALEALVTGDVQSLLADIYVVALVIGIYTYVWAILNNVYLFIRILLNAGKSSFLVYRNVVYYEGLNTEHTDINTGRFLEVCSAVTRQQREDREEAQRKLEREQVTIHIRDDDDTDM